jgi:O-antigen ligase
LLKLFSLEISWMSDVRWKIGIILAGGVLLLTVFLFVRPEYLSNPEVLGGVLVAEIVLAALCRYRRVFFMILMAAFLWAGLDLPLHGAWLQGRWFVLAIGALAGIAIYLKDPNHHFSAFHLIACFCVLSAVVSGLVSGYPEEALLKAISLMLLFAYGLSGARLAVPTLRPEVFFRGLLLGCEALTYISAISYFVLRSEIYGSPNSLGAVMGVAVVPMLLWGLLTSQNVIQRRRRAFEFTLAMLLLLSSFARAGIAAAVVSCLLVCITLRQYRLMVKGIAAAVVLAVVTVMFVPLPQEAPKWDGSESITNMFLYKGKPEQGVMGSRKGVWDQTWAVITDHPWFGTGFGTSVTGEDLTRWEFARSHIDSRMVREHGNSFLAIAEWVGLLGVVPFYFLIAVTALNVRKVFSWMRRTGDVFSPAVPAAAVLVAGLVDAMFEDWLFAVGYYLCVLFWALAFILVDVLPQPAVVYSREDAIPMPAPRFSAVASGQ